MASLCLLWKGIGWHGEYCASEPQGCKSALFTRDAAAGIFLHDAPLMHACLPIGYSAWERDDIAGQCGRSGVFAGSMSVSI